jgi:hypothetical protein
MPESVTAAQQKAGEKCKRRRGAERFPGIVAHVTIGRSQPSFDVLLRRFLGVRETIARARKPVIQCVRSVAGAFACRIRGTFKEAFQFRRDMLQLV